MHYARFTIRGRGTDDAVLCTASQTYALRAVTLSNTILVVTAPSSASMDMEMESDLRASELIVRDEVRFLIVYSSLEGVELKFSHTSYQTGWISALHSSLRLSS